MSGLRGRSAVPADHRSALPRVPGIPWWGAAIVAIVLTAIGVAYDAGSGNDNLGAVFAVCYVLGCVAAVLAVRQSGVFTAVIQPPLILFVAVPTAYFVFHGSTFTGIKDTLINYGYPLIERFPLMFFTSATVLVIGMVRWYLGVAARRSGTPVDDEAVVDAPEDVPEVADAAVGATSGRRAGVRAQRSTRAARAADAAALADPIEDETPRAPRRSPRTGSARPSDPFDDDAPRAPRRSSRTSTGSERPATASGSRRSRHARPSETEIIEPVRPRKRPAAETDAPAEPRRRPRAGEPRDREPREREPREREPREREPRDRDRDREPRERTPRERREPREPRDRRPLPPLDTRSGQERAPRRERPEGYERPERPRRPRPADYEPYEPPPSRANGSSTHHPVSRVRYRGAEDGESRTENRSRRPRHSAPDSWEYDV